MSIVSVLICDRHRLFRSGLKRLLPSRRYRIAFEAECLAEARSWLDAHPGEVELLICDLIAGEVDSGYIELKDIVRQNEGVAAVVLTDHADHESFDRAAEAGARGVLSKNLSEAGLQSALELILLDDTIFLSPFRPPRRERSEPAKIVPMLGPGLSEREDEVLSCLVGGLSNKEIARKLSVAETTVKVHLKSLMKKLNTNNRTQAAIWAMTKGSGSHATGPVIEGPSNSVERLLSQSARATQAMPRSDAASRIATG